MDADRFDTLTRSLVGAATSRRRLLAGVAGSALAALAAALGAAGVGATHYGCRHVGKPCGKDRQCCSGRCRGRGGDKTCRAHDAGNCTVAKDVCFTDSAGCGGGACYCYRTPGGANFCSASGGGHCMPCATDAQCASALATPGSACVDFTHCPVFDDCDGHDTACVPPCSA